MRKARIVIILLIVCSWSGSYCFAQAGPSRTCEETCKPTLAVNSFLSAYNLTGNPLDRLTVGTVPLLRQTEEMIAVSRPVWTPMGQLLSLGIDKETHSIPVSVYIPRQKFPGRDRLPVLIFFHGGGWTLGSTAVYDPIIRKLASEIPAIVVSPDYRLAPEHPFPAAVHDCFSTFQWVLEHISKYGGDPSCIIVSGDSAGGNLATVTARKAKELGHTEIHFEALFYPSVDIADTGSPSADCFKKDYVLTTSAIESFRSFYLPHQRDWINPDASPLRSHDLQGMPATLIITAGCDPLLDEGIAYGEKLSSKGVSVIHQTEPGIFHGYLNFYHLNPMISPIAGKTLEYAAEVIREAIWQK